MTDGPWIDTHEGTMWSYGPPLDSWGRKTAYRNEALWAAKVAERTEFVKLSQAWRDAAVADGWAMRPTYGDHESVDTAFRLERDGFEIQGLARPGAEKSLPTAIIHIWGPDGLAIEPPLTYDWDAIQRGHKTCSACAAYPVEIERVGFAGRYCTPCAEIWRPRIETPGWAE